MATKKKQSSVPTEQEIELRANAELEPLQESAALNKLLLRNARQSLVVISQKTGIPVDEVSERLTALLDNPSWRDDLMEEKLLLAEVTMLVDDIRDRMSRYDVEDEGWASMARVQLAAIRTMLEQLDKRRKAVNGELALVTKGQAELFAQGLQLAMERAAFTLQKQFPDADPELIYEVVESGLPEAIEYVEAHVEH